MTDWQTVKLGDVAYEISERVDNPSTSGYDRFVGLENFVSGDFRISSWGTTENLISAMKLFKAGDTLFARRNAYLKRASMADFDGICSGDAIVLRNNEKMIDGFLPLILNTDHFWNYAIANAAGSMSKRVRVEDLMNYKFPLPPVDEQRRIADLLWAADDAIVQYENLLETSKVLLQSTIEEAIKVAQEHNSWATLNELIESNKPITYGILKPGTGYPGGIPVIKVKDYPDGIIIEDNLLLTSPEIESEYKRSRLKAGDLLISIRGTVGRLAFVPPSLDGANITQDTARISLSSSVNHLYVRSMLESNHIQRQIKSKITGLAVQGINIGELRKIEIPILSREEQDKVSDEIFQIRTSIKEIEKHLELSKDLKKKLLNSSLS